MEVVCKSSPPCHAPCLIASLICTQAGLEIMINLRPRKGDLVLMGLDFCLCLMQKMNILHLKELVCLKV
jgi:hypothetical protein